jgi:endonuclease/exonuclease/phosphatase family metal-dependent hydrolase
VTGSLGVVSFNVCGLPGMPVPLARRTAEFCRHLDAGDADVINLQEVFSRRSLVRIRAGLTSYPHVAWRRGLGGHPAGGLATFSRRPISDVGYRSFRAIVPPTGSVRFRTKRAVNSLLQGVLTVTLPGVTVVNTHLTANKDGDWSPGNRYFAYQRAQLTRLHQVLARLTGPVVVTGDFNLASQGALYPLIVPDGWHDVFAGTDQVTYHPAFLPPGAGAHRIDYVLLRGGVSVLDARLVFSDPVTVDGADLPPMFVSDHVALSARLSLPS